MTMRPRRREPGPRAVLCRSEWSLFALAVAAESPRWPRVAMYRVDWLARFATWPDYLCQTILTGTAMAPREAECLREWYAAGGELPLTPPRDYL